MQESDGGWRYPTRIALVSPFLVIVMLRLLYIVLPFHIPSEYRSIGSITLSSDDRNVHHCVGGRKGQGELPIPHRCRRVFHHLREHIREESECSKRVAGIGGGGWLLEVTHLEVT